MLCPRVKTPQASLNAYMYIWRALILNYRESVIRTSIFFFLLVFYIISFSTWHCGIFLCQSIRQILYSPTYWHVSQRLKKQGKTARARETSKTAKNARRGMGVVVWAAATSDRHPYSFMKRLPSRGLEPEPSPGREGIGKREENFLNRTAGPEHERQNPG